MRFAGVLPPLGATFTLILLIYHMLKEEYLRANTPELPPYAKNYKICWMHQTT
jgi:hypothetical protein